MDLFEHAYRRDAARNAPLAVRMRPRTLEELYGQEEVIGPGSLLRRAIEQDLLQSLILYGPPGTGKTALAWIIAGMTKAHFHPLNAVMATVKDIRTVVEEAKERAHLYRQRTVLFLDEIHRFNRAQQDALLPFVEDGTLILIGATTENPFFSVNGPLLSRSRVVALAKLKPAHLEQIIANALQDEERGLGAYAVKMTEAAKEWLARAANGDARVALNALEFAATVCQPGPDGLRIVDLDLVKEALQTRPIDYGPGGDAHFDHASALIKSIRGSDPQAAVYWLARMLKGGEDINFITRRLLILAAEDIGLADPQGLVVANAAAQAAERVGLPEARIILSQAVIYLACAPKSNRAYVAIDKALQAVEALPAAEVPIHLRDAHYPGARSLGHGLDYKYPHDHPGARVDQDYLPASLQGMVFYEPSDEGFEARIKESFVEEDS
ncbi:MAG: replication-associated recombination protein A [Firmicutes bacterium]|nr:replication-associated recombination protein A [Bacillota bacterium]